MQIKRYHVTAIGGRAMHNLAIALKEQGHHVTGSDLEIAEPARSRLAAAGLLPTSVGWQPHLITPEINCVIAGPQSYSENPEIVQAKELGIPVLSFSEFILSHAQNKQRLVVAGSYAKTTVVAIILHVLEACNRSFDYVVSSPGIDDPIRLSDNAPLIIIEGDEPAAAPGLRHYQHHIGVISDIAWNHSAAFPSEEAYIRQFEAFADATPKGGTIIFNETDAASALLGRKERPDVQAVPFTTHPFEMDNGHVLLVTGNKEKIPLKIFGRHNLLNVAAAKEVLKKIGITAEQFYQAIPEFTGAFGHLEKVHDSGRSVIFKDVAQAPAAVRAATEAVKEQYARHPLTAVLELTNDSLVPSFLPQYKNTLKACEEAIIFLDAEKTSLSAPVDENALRQVFQHRNLTVITSATSLQNQLAKTNSSSRILLLMSQNSMAGLNISVLATTLTP